MATISSLSTVYVKVPVFATENGAVVVPTSATVQIAYTNVGSEPISGDWTAGDWETDASRTPSRYLARVLTGPDGDVTLTDGTYDVWVKVTGITPEVPVIRAGSPLVVT